MGRYDDNANSVADLIKKMSDGKAVGRELHLDTDTGKLVSVSINEGKVDGQIKIDHEDAKMYSENISNIVFLYDKLEELKQQIFENNQSEIICNFDLIDDVLRMQEDGDIKGLIFNSKKKVTKHAEEYALKIAVGDDLLNASYNENTINVIVTPSSKELYSRVKGIYETDSIANKKVLFIGLGSGNSPTALELVKQGVLHFVLIDFDRLELSNVSRHVCGLNDIGRYKTKAVADLLKNKNPYVDVTTYEVDITETSYEFREKLLEGIDLVICGTDNRKSRLLVNRMCIEHNVPCIYGGAFRRAYGGQVLHVIPHKTMCYQCFLRQLPNVAEDYEISNQHQVDEIAYSDITNISIEPGLSTDIAPISTMVSKLAILDLLKGKDHSLKELYTDLNSALYLWFNRREPGTQWDEVLHPNIGCYDKMTILRWYGINAERVDNCPVCGSFLPEID